MFLKTFNVLVKWFLKDYNMHFTLVLQLFKVKIHVREHGYKYNKLYLKIRKQQNNYKKCVNNYVYYQSLNLSKILLAGTFKGLK